MIHVYQAKEENRMSQEETIFYLETWDGALVRVPESKLDAFQRQQKHQKQLARQGRTVEAPAEFTAKLSELMEGRKPDGREG